jgi:hypothetical protein
VVPEIAGNHRKMLVRESRLVRKVIRRRGYRTVRTKAELERLGFGRAQRNVPGLLIPIYGPSGDRVLYQYRPDDPRIRDGKTVKYETPSAARMALDIHPLVRDRLDDPTSPLFVTEGVKKADALVSRGICAVGLIGVWNWRGTNAHGGKTALPEWEQIALNGRLAYIVFDSDVMLKKEVYAALVRLKAFLESRNAKVALIYLPPDESGGKQGVDDYLAAGQDVKDLLALATTELSSPPHDEQPSIPYRATPEGLIWDRTTRDGAVSTLPTNFSAKIVADLAEDDGVEVRRSFEIEAELGERRRTFTVPATAFVGMGWATEHLGAGAVVYPGFGLKDHARAAVQLLSGEVPSRRVFTHLGWRKVDGEWLYLHGGGAIGPLGPLDSIQTELGGPLGSYALPTPPTGEDLGEAIRASLGLLDLAPDEITVPLLAATYRAVLGDTDFSVHLSGPTGAGKTELAAVFARHFGVDLDARRLPSWESTENAVEALAFGAKDAVMVIDDFAPTGTTYDVQRWHKKADRVLRAAGNRAGRSRMRPDTTLRAEKPPRCLIISTGEDVPRGQSLRARILILELGPGQLNFEWLTVCQKQADVGLYASAMAGYLRWLAQRYEIVKARMREQLNDLRDAAGRSGRHKRTPEITANLALGWKCLLRFALDAEAVTSVEAEDLWQRGWEVLDKAQAKQSQHQAAQEPTQRFLELLSAAITSGRAHLANTVGENPEHPEAWGWRFFGDEWRPQGERVGWIDGEDLYLQPEAAYAAAQKQGQDAGDPLTVASRTLNKRLHERGLLLSIEAPHLTVRRVLQGKRSRVLHLPAGSLSFNEEKVGQVGHGNGSPTSNARHIPPLWPTDEVGHEGLSGPRTTRVGHENIGNRADHDPVGPDGPLSEEVRDHTRVEGDTLPSPARIKGRV